MAKNSLNSVGKTSETSEAVQRLRCTVAELESAVIAFSGGVDSTLLARIAYEELTYRCAAVTVSSELRPSGHLDDARKLARLIGIDHHVIGGNELDIPGFAQNPPERCYLCKKEMFARMRNFADRLGFKHIIDGTNADDVGEDRPGLKAAAEFMVRSPLREVGFTKEMIRKASRKLGLPNWNRPSFACLATRFAYGQPVTSEELHRVEAAEELLHQLGLKQYRVRVHGTIARIEVEPGDLPGLLKGTTRTEFVKALRELGFTYITVDLAGFRSGSMNETL